MAKQTFTAGQVLTAAQVNALQTNDFNLTVTTQTGDYTLQASDKGTRVVANKATAIAFTVNNSVFSAGDIVQIHNIGAGTLTVTAGTATVTSADVLTVSQWQAGTLYFTSASAAIWFPNAKTSGLTLISSTTIGSAVSSVTVSNAFSSSFDSYEIIVSGGVASADDINLNLTLGATATGYYQAGFYTGGSWTSAVTANSRNNQASWNGGQGSTVSLSGNVRLIAPNLAKRTSIISQSHYVGTAGYMNYLSGFLNDATQYTAFTYTASTGTMTGGTIKVYGYQNS